MNSRQTARLEIHTRELRTRRMNIGQITALQLTVGDPQALEPRTGEIDATESDGLECNSVGVLARQGGTIELDIEVFTIMDQLVELFMLKPRRQVRRPGCAHERWSAHVVEASAKGGENRRKRIKPRLSCDTRCLR